MLHAGRILSNPVKIARHYHVLRPLLSEEIHFTPNLDKYRLMLSHARDLSLNERITSGIQPYQDLHFYVRECLEKLNSKHVMFVTGTSSNWATEKAKNKGIDYFSVANKLGEELMLIMRELSEEINVSDWKFIPVTPFIGGLEFVIDQGKLVMKHTHQKEIEKVNNNQYAEGKLELGSSEKKLDEYELKAALYQFGEYIYDSGIAKKVMDVPKGYTLENYERILKDCTSFNKHIIAIVYSRIIDILDLPTKDGKKVIDVYASKSSYAYKIMQLACKYNGNAKLSDWNLFKDVKKPVEAELNSIVLKRLKRRILNRNKEYKKLHSGVKDELSDLL